MDYHTPSDPETKSQLLVIAMDESKKRLTEMETALKLSKELANNLSARLKIIEDSKLIQELQILQAAVKELKKKMMEMDKPLIKKFFK